MSQRLAGKVAIVTGGGNGIGRAEALALAQAGAKVVIADFGIDNGVRRADKVVEEIRKAGGAAAPCAENVSTFAGASALVDTAIKHFGRLDILVNNAGLRAANPIQDMTEEHYDRVIDSHLKSTYATIKYAAPHFIRQRSGVIVNTGSESGLGHPINSAYAAAKEGIAGLTRTVARELGRFNIRCNLLRPRASTGTKAPEFEDTLKKYKPLLDAWNKAGFSVGRRGYTPGNKAPEAVGVAVAWLCTDAAANFNGCDFEVFGEIIALLSQPAPLYEINRKGGWDLDALDEMMPRTLGLGIKNEYLLPGFEE